MNMDSLFIFFFEGLATSYTIWALHSDSENEILNSLSFYQKGSPKWDEFRSCGAGWWLKNLSTLRMCVEKVAKVAFQSNNDPMDAALYYLAMKKKNLLTHLYKYCSFFLPTGFLCLIFLN